MVAPARARALTCVAGDDHPGVSELVFWAPSTTRVSVSAARATTPRLRCSDASLQCGARRGRCVRATASTGRARAAGNHSNVSTAPRAPQPLQANRRSAWGRRLQQRCVNRDKTSVFARSAAYTTHQLRRRGCRCVLVRLQTLAQLFLPQPATGVSAHQRFISTTASKPSFPACSGAPLAGPEDSMPLASH